MNVSHKTVANTSTAIKRKLSARSYSDLIRIAVNRFGASPTNPPNVP